MSRGATPMVVQQITPGDDGPSDLETLPRRLTWRLIRVTAAGGVVLLTGFLGPKWLGQIVLAAWFFPVLLRAVGQQGVSLLFLGVAALFELEGDSWPMVALFVVGVVEECLLALVLVLLWGKLLSA
ncbi:MAG: hypothetical protein JWM11_6725 [Planctomycetaceae bacterium]|nr:hypothetical protein [Planctomycetaceae bacterium]